MDKKMIDRMYRKNYYNENKEQLKMYQKNYYLNKKLGLVCPVSRRIEQNYFIKEYGKFIVEFD
jgi:hypothetical protein